MWIHVWTSDVVYWYWTNSQNWTNSQIVWICVWTSDGVYYRHSIVFPQKISVTDFVDRLQSHELIKKFGVGIEKTDKIYSNVDTYQNMSTATQCKFETLLKKHEKIMVHIILLMISCYFRNSWFVWKELPETKTCPMKSRKQIDFA